MPTAAADPVEVQRARRLCTAMRQAGVQHVIYNGSAGRGSKAGISQACAKLHLTNLRASLHHTLCAEAWMCLLGFHCTINFYQVVLFPFFSVGYLHELVASQDQAN